MFVKVVNLCAFVVVGNTFFVLFVVVDSDFFLFFAVGRVLQRLRKGCLFFGEVKTLNKHLLGKK